MINSVGIRSAANSGRRKVAEFDWQFLAVVLLIVSGRFAN